MTEGKKQAVGLEYDIYIRASQGDVWKAIVTPDQVRRYYPCPLRELGPVGGPATYGNDEEVFIEGKVLEREDGKLLVHDFRFTDREDKSVVIYMLEQDKDSPFTRLTLKHSDFESENETFHDVASTWPFILSSMKSMLETGKSLWETE